MALFLNGYQSFMDEKSNMRFDSWYYRPRDEWGVNMNEVLHPRMTTYPAIHGLGTLDPWMEDIYA